MLSEGQRNDVNFAIPMLEQIDIGGSQVVADRGYDSTKLLDYIYGRGGGATGPTRNGGQFGGRGDGAVFKECHLGGEIFF